MDTVNLGKTGLRVSRLCLGCMTYGEPQRGNHPWTLGEEESRPFIKAALDKGITFFDTANVYSDGSSEEIVGRALLDYVPRHEIVLATKVHGKMREDANGRGLSRKAIMSEIDASLKRLKTDFIDLYQIHRFDPTVPIEETLEALDDVVKAGKALYIGASSMYAWQFCKALQIADRHGWTRFVSMQNHYNLMYREEEREMMGLCREEGVGVIPWSPMARGKLTRPWTDDTPTKRAETDAFGKTLYVASDKAVVDAVRHVAEARGLPMAQIALAWLLAKPGVTAPIIGASKQRHLEDAVAALDVTLSSEEMNALEAPYAPHAVAGFS